MVWRYGWSQSPRVRPNRMSIGFDGWASAEPSRPEFPVAAIPLLVWPPFRSLIDLRGMCGRQGRRPGPRAARTAMSDDPDALFGPRTPRQGVHRPAKAKSGLSSARANHLGVFRGFVSAYWQNDVAGTTQRLVGPEPSPPMRASDVD
jgi:hypothetical protein